MLENAAFIQGELKNVKISDTNRARAEDVCTALIGTKHDVIHELFEIDEPLSSRSIAEEVVPRLRTFLDWFKEDINAMSALVMELRTASEQDAKCGSAYILVAESTVNIVDAFNRVWDATNFPRFE